MSKKPKEISSSGLSGEILGLIPDFEVHPWESVESFKALEEGLIAEFAPASAMEVSLVKRLAANDWEQHRSDKLRADITRTCLRKSALEFLMENGLDCLPNASVRKTANDLVSENAALRASAIKKLVSEGIDVAELHATPYLQSFREFEALERRADVFDRRRRDLLEDLKKLQKHRQEADIVDAELVEAHDD